MQLTKHNLQVLEVKAGNNPLKLHSCPQNRHVWEPLV